MITFLTEPYPDEETLRCLHPLVKEWFLARFEKLSPPQQYSIKNISDGKNTLISSPTGSGKTLSAFLSIINHLVTLQEEGRLEEKVYCVYVSPLKALANDITKNLKEPLKEMEELAKREKKRLNITVASRTGDTTRSQRASMLKKPPHILITTPESLAIILTTTRFREMLRTTRYLIIDEIHALAENKRGVHLSLTLERLEALVKERHPEAHLIRIGLSATVSPLTEVAKFLVGLAYPRTSGHEYVTRNCDIVDVQAFKKHDLKVLCPVKDVMRATHEEMQAALYAQLHDLIQQHRTTLIFTNTRAATERVVHNLKTRYPHSYHTILDGDYEEERLEEETATELREEERKHRGLIGAHHGSLSKTHRLRIERQLKRGELKAVVCSTSLELGIDIGSIDLVVLLGSPKSVARALQRIGRAGHQLHETAKGRIFVLDRDDMVECAVLLKSAIERKIDKIRIPHNALDVLAQQLFSMAIENVWQYEELFWTVRKSYCYSDLPKEDFDAVLAYLAGEYSSLEDRHVYAKIWWDRETGKIGKRGKLARLIALTNTGTIPDETRVKVKIKDEIIGTIDEAFLEQLTPGDVFVLGGETYEFRYSRGMTAQVKACTNRPPTVPRWASEMLPLSYDLALEIQRFRQYLHELFQHGRDKEAIISFMREYLYADEQTLNSIYEYFREQEAYSKVPHRHRIVIEQYRDGKKRHAIVHSLYGRRVNDVLSRALAYVLGRMHKRDVAVSVTDTGFMLTATTPLNVQRAFALLQSDELEAVMRAALEKTEVLARRFRHCALRALMILRTYKGDTKSVGKQQMNSRLLYNAVRRISNDFPILKEARREVLEEKMDLPNARAVLKAKEAGSVKVEEVQTSIPSPFAFTIILQGYSDILKMEERVAFLKRMHELVLEEMKGKRGGRRGENEAFSYETFWRTAEERRSEEKELTPLRREVWNLPHISVSVKDALITALETGRIREDIKEALEQRKEEILKTWPPPLIKELFRKLGIAYDEAVLEREAEKGLLRRQLAMAARKIDEVIRKDFEHLIDGEELEDGERFWAWAREEFTGTVHKAWADEIVKWMLKRIGEKNPTR